MKHRVLGMVLSVCALWFYALPAAPAEGIRIAQAPQNGPPIRAPRAPAAGQTAPPLHLGEDSRVQAPPTKSAQAPATPAQTAAPAPPRIPTRTEILNFENWAVTCSEFADGPRARQCSALLQILQQNTNQTVFTWTIAMDERKQLVAIMQTPTGVVIPPGVELRVGKFPPQKIPFASCDTGRCVATAPMDANLLREMTKSPTAEAVIQGSQGNAVQFNIQLKGFDKAFGVLSR
jgi:invasion protein IalB